MPTGTAHASRHAQRRLLLEAASRLARGGRALAYMGLDRVGRDLMRIAKEVEAVAEACCDTSADSSSGFGDPAPSDAQS
jgi:hypothetical protein